MERENVAKSESASINTEKLIEIAKQIVYKKHGKYLKDIQVDILRGTLQKHDYRRIARATYKTEEHIRKAGSLLWKLLSEALGEKITKTNIRETLERSLTLQENQKATNPQISSKNQHQDWGDAPDVGVFFGRDAELATLKQWIVCDRCRLVAILGMGGIGKTAVSIKLGKGGIGKTDLSLKLAQEIQAEFEYVIWRKLLNAPPVTEIIADLIKFLSHQQETDLPDNIDKQISLVLKYLKEHRCLIILDNVETILEGGNCAVKYKKEFEEYGQLFETIGQVAHQSCLLLTSREKIGNLERLEGKVKPVRFLELKGLNNAEGRRIFEAINNFSGSDEQWKKLIELYDGNPLALELAAHHIQNVFGGDLSEFLRAGKPIFADLRELLDWHFERLSEREKEIIYWLAIHREPISIANLRDDIVWAIAQNEVEDTLRSLQRKLPLEKSDNKQSFTLQPVLIEYITEKLIQTAIAQLPIGEIQLFNNHALIQAQAKDYVRESQIRMILEPVKQRLIAIFTCQLNLETHFNSILSQLRQNFPLQPGYAGGNIFNLFRLLKTNLKGYDFSHLTIWQADFRDIALHEVKFSHSDLSKSVFTQSFGGIHSLAFSSKGDYFAAGDSNGKIHLLRMEDEQPIATFQKHNWWTVSLAFSSDDEKLVSSSIDGTIKLWDVSTKQCLHNLVGHTQWIWTVAFSRDNQIIASGSNDETIRLWDANTGQNIRTIKGHSSWVLAIAFSPRSSQAEPWEPEILASGSHDKTIKLWDIKTGKCLKTFQGHEDAIWSVAFSPDGKTIASCGCDKTIKLWDVETGECRKNLIGHKKEIKVLAFSPDGKTLASGCFEPTVKFWNVETGECKATGKGHRTGVRSLAFNSDNKTVATGDNDQIVKLWDAQTGKCIKTLQGHTNWVWSVACSPDGRTIASSHLDHTVRLWDVSTGNCLKTFTGHTAWIWSVACSSDGKTIASSGDDETIRLWDVDTGQCRKCLQYLSEEYQGGIWTIAFSPNGLFLASGGQNSTVKIWNLKTGNYRILAGHERWIWTVAFSYDSKLLASGSDDQTIKIWDVTTGECLQTLQGHTNNVRSVAFSLDGKFLVSGSEDNTLKLWDIITGECLQTLRGHEAYVWSVGFSSKGKFIVSGSHDYTLKLWNASNGKCVKTLRKHTDKVTSVAFIPNSQTIVSSSLDGTINLWEVESGKCFKTLRVPRPYEGTNVTGVKGLTDGQKETLLALGAVVDF